MTKKKKSREVGLLVAKRNRPDPRVQGESGYWWVKGPTYTKGWRKQKEKGNVANLVGQKS